MPGSSPPARFEEPPNTIIDPDSYATHLICTII
jgi:hypothetical protein